MLFYLQLDHCCANLIHIPPQLSSNVRHHCFQVIAVHEVRRVADDLQSLNEVRSTKLSSNFKYTRSTRFVPERDTLEI